MKKSILCLLICYVGMIVKAQPAKTEMYDLIKKIISDSTGYPNVGDWDAGSAKNYPVKWKDDRIIMSEDTSTNFYRTGTVDITIKNKSFMQAGKPLIWNIMLKGPRMGYTSFAIISSPSNEMQAKFTIDSIFGKKPFTAKLLKSCDAKTLSGYYYYEIKLPKKDIVYIKLSWLSVNGNTAMRIDCYDKGSEYAAKLDCPN